MPVELKQAGDFRGRVLEYGLHEKEGSESVSLAIRISADEVWMVPEGGEEPMWLDCSGWDSCSVGFLCLVTKAGKLNPHQVDPLMKYAGWDGDFEALANGTWEPNPIRFSVEYDTFGDKGKFRINWIYPFDSEPGGNLGNVDADRAKQLKNKFGAQIRALGGNAARDAAPKPAGKPAAPAGPKTRGKRKAAPAAPAAPEREPGIDEDDEIPF